MIQLVLGLFINLLFIFAVNLEMIMIYRLLIGFCSMFITIAVKYIVDNPHELEQKIHLLAIVIAWKLGQLLGVFVSDYMTDGQFPFVIVGGISFAIILIIITTNYVITFITWTVEKIAEINNKDYKDPENKVTIPKVLSEGDTHERLEREPFNDIMEHSDKSENNSNQILATKITNNEQIINNIQTTNDNKINNTQIIIETHKLNNKIIKHIDTFNDEIKNVFTHMFKLFKDKKYRILLLCISILTSLNTTYTDILKIFLTIKTDLTNQTNLTNQTDLTNNTFDTNSISTIIMSSLALSFTLESIVVYLINKITTQKYLGQLISIIMLLILYPFLMPFETNRENKYSISIILNGFIIALFGTLIYIVHNDLYLIQHPKKIALSYGLIKNFTLAFNVIFSVIFSLILNFTTEKINNNNETIVIVKSDKIKYVTDINLIFYTFILFLIIASCMYYYKLTIDDEPSTEEELSIELDDKNTNHDNVVNMNPDNFVNANSENVINSNPDNVINTNSENVANANGENTDSNSNSNQKDNRHVIDKLTSMIYSNIK
jgi:hypothetical protein